MIREMSKKDQIIGLKANIREAKATENMLRASILLQEKYEKFLVAEVKRLIHQVEILKGNV